MERGRLKQRISNAFRASLRSSCSIRNVTDAVQEPVFLCRRHVNVGEERELVHGWPRRSISLSSQDRVLLTHRRELATSRPRRPSVDFAGRRPGAVTRKPEEKSKMMVPGVGGALVPPVSPSYYYFWQMKEELERQQRRIAAKKEKETCRTKKKLLSNSYGFTSSSSENSDADADADFSSDGREESLGERWSSKDMRAAETEAFFSSRSFSSDSSGFYYSSCRRRYSRRERKTSRRQRPLRETPKGDDGLRPLVRISSCSSSCDTAREQVMGEVEAERAGFAMEKQSSDPREDFRSSMLEMIMEEQMFGASDLEKLLHCYLRLNSSGHHQIIVEVFSEIWGTLFSN